MTTVVRRPGGSMADVLDWFESSTGLGLRGLGLSSYVRVEDYTEDGTYVLRAEMPGIDPDKDVSLTIENDVLTIQGERHEEEKDKNHHEFHYGSFTRRIPLPHTVRADDVTATYTDGVLEVRVPVKADEEPVTTIPVRRAE